jgi:hypothetical protein
MNADREIGNWPPAQFGLKNDIVKTIKRRSLLLRGNTYAPQTTICVEIGPEKK